MDSTKVCRLCQMEQPITEFDLNSKGCKDGRDSRCKGCERKRRLAGYYTNRSVIAARMKAWRTSHPEESKAIHRRAGKKLRAKLIAITRQIRSDNPCTVCSEARINCLEFHHLDPATKLKAVAACVSVRQLKAEISKCIVLCSNCHALYNMGDVTIPTGTTGINPEKYFSF